MNDGDRERWVRLLLLSLAAGLLFLKQTVPVVVVGIPFSPWLMVTAAGVVLIALAPAIGAAGRSLALRILAIDAVISLITEGDLLSFRINRRFISLLSLPLVPQLPYFRDAIFSAISPADVLLFADLVLFAGAAVFLPRRENGKRRRVVAIAAAGLAVIAASVAADPYFRDSNLRNPATAAHLTLMPFHLAGLASAGATSLRGRYFATGEVSQLQRWYAQRRAPPSPPLLETLPQFDNVITVQFESLQHWAVPLRLGQVEVMPNLNRLRESGISLEQVYSQVGMGNTSDAEFLALCSLYPATAGTAFLRYTSEALNCLPSVLRRLNFDTAAFHGNDLAVYDRLEMYVTLGFSRRYGRKALIPETSIPVLPDEIFFEHVEPLLENRRRFYAHVVTYSSHRPFRVPPQGLPLGALAGTTVGNYLESLHYADEALGRFLDHLRARGLLDRTLVVIYGDHGGVNREDSGVLDLPLPRPRSEADWFFFERHIPVLISGPGLRPAKPNLRAGQIDIAPTIAGLLGISLAHTGFLGRDLFGTVPLPVVFWSGNVLDANHLYLADSRLCFTASGGPAGEHACEGLASFGEEERREAQLALDADLVTLLDP